MTRELHVDLDADRLSALGLTAGNVNAQLRATSADLSGGRGEVGTQEQAIRTLGAARTLDDLAATRIALPNGRQLRLSDVATVTRTRYEEPRHLRPARTARRPWSASPSSGPRGPAT